MANTQPFFSLVIPCYNDGRYAPGVYLDKLLTNIKEQGLKKSDIEIIVSDDCSPIPYQGTLDKYKDALDIKFVSTDYNCGPGGTREKGASIATGQWLCFADHDDKFYPGALKYVRDRLKRTKEQLFAYADFNKVDLKDDNVIVEAFREPNLGTWVHGKFYNLENFWRKYDLHFLEGLRTHEDIALGVLVDCVLHHLGNPKCLHLTKPVYMWTNNPRSISNTQYVNAVDASGDIHSFVEASFGNTLTATIEPYLISYKKGIISRDEAILMTLSRWIGHWFQLSSFKVQSKNYLKENDAYSSRIWKKIKAELNLTAASAKVIVSKSLSDLKVRVDNTAARYNLPNLYDWIDDMDSDKYLPLLDSIEAKYVRTNKRTRNIVNTSSERPFFSLVIACYNDGRYKKGVYLDRLLASICRQGLNREDVEVILSDDCSPVPYDSIVADYEDKLIIKRTKTDYNCCPGNTRAKGVEIATGRWLCFADHDDIYYDGTMKQVKDGITERKEKYFAFGDFNGVDSEGKVVRKFEAILNWCHGKFYNIDNFWKPQGIHFIKDLKSHEDIAICTQVACAMHALNLPNYTYFHFPVYAWTDNPQSVSHAKYTVDTEAGPREFLEVFFDDYIHATGWFYITEFKAHRIKIQFAVKGALEIMCYCYFYLQGFQFRRPEDFYKANLASAGEYIRACKETFNLTNESIYAAISSNDAAMYCQILELANPGSGRYMPVQTFKEWLEIVCNSYK